MCVIMHIFTEWKKIWLTERLTHREDKTEEPLQTLSSQYWSFMSEYCIGRKWGQAASYCYYSNYYLYASAILLYKDDLFY
jgi:hypothetical protein